MSFIQSVIFDKRYFTKEKAIQHLESYPQLKNNKIYDSDNFYHFRQVNPLYQNVKYRIINPTVGVRFIIGFQKKDEDSDTDSD